MICSSKWKEYCRINTRSSERTNVHFLYRVAFCNYSSYMFSNSVVIESVRSTTPFPLTSVVSFSRQPTLMLVEFCQRIVFNQQSAFAVFFKHTVLDVRF